MTPWRRAVAGDLTSAFDFRTPNRDRPVRLPDTADFKPADLVRHPDEVPVPPKEGRLPGQERGVRPARALSYTLHADGAVAGQVLTVTFRNTGEATAVFLARSTASGEQPRTYTVEPGKSVTGTWAAARSYDVSVHGPNGFCRTFVGSAQAPAVAMTTEYDQRAEKVTLSFTNPGPEPVQLTIRDRYTGRQTTVPVRGGRAASRSWGVARTRGWYDLTVTAGKDLHRRYAGHLENGRDSISDPAMGGLVQSRPDDGPFTVAGR
ncbi:phospholipase domain-containing protein [Actinoplanes sp. NPDC048791]|uniref:phospholipase domain-containing protein n=1 Tax=Actinoplanes sp. NPDC048791 TaxID=3154623 RepID=UPI0033FA7953